MNTSVTFSTAKPAFALQKFIAYYYFQTQDKPQAEHSFLYFPHFKNALTIYKNSEAENYKDASYIKSNTEINYTILFSTIYKSSRFIKISGRFDKVGIVFNPLGIQYFLQEEALSTILQDDLHFHHFGRHFTACLDQVYAATAIDEKVKLLDTFFNANIQSFTNELLQQAIARIHADDIKYTVQTLADTLGVHRRKLLRVFQKHLCCSVKVYLDTVQFRKAFTTYQLAESKPSLTSLSYNNNYFDQSELIKHFKKLTKNNPSKLFKNVVHLGDEDTFWQVNN
ncbi:MAG: AraC family transcriptional regulator [Bacteroidota bacterium]